MKEKIFITKKNLKYARSYFSLYFPIRHYLRRDIGCITKEHKIQGKILDVGCGEKPFVDLFSDSEYLGIDFTDYSKNRDAGTGKPDYFFDDEYKKTHTLPFENDSFDHTVSFQVLEHHPEPEILISEMARITKRDGFVLITCPFIYALHEEPNDFQRLTEYKLKNLFEKNNCEIIEIKKQGSFFSAVSMLANEQLNYFAARGRFNYFIAAIFYPLFLIHQYTSILMDAFFRSEKVFINYAILVRKLE